ncbi:MAG: GPR endopeptidase [Clostridiales bacterium]|nr:GPR endopeptidase [Bacillota bacterium]MEE0517047.1 GPR endopeptidase [Anaerovoracaceae bacterium]PWL93200.1 MAG: GPR endopeptidase [Clostridiales bacterium]
MQYRTDLAIENHELIEEAKARATGYIKKQQQKDEDICVTEIIITDEQGETAFGKPKGTYITIEVDGILEQKDKIKERAAHTLAEELKKMIKFDYYLKVLVVGLGNEKVTPDSLGPHTVDKVKITAHLFEMFEADGDWEMANVSGFNPSVTGVTGMETADLIEKVTSMVHPDVVLIVDSLAARNIDRMSTTIQLCDTGIEPGAGMGNRRKAISEETLGCKVVSIGVPTVIDSRNLIIEAAQATEFADEKKIDKYFKDKELNMIVTSTDIDEIIKDFSDIIANAINITLHPGIYS